MSEQLNISQSFLRETVRSVASLQSQLDYEDVLNTCEATRASFAAGDVFTAGTIPFLKDLSITKTTEWMTGPIISMNEDSLTLIQSCVPKKRSISERAAYEGKMLTHSFDLLAKAKESHDPNSIFFQVAKIYEEIKMYDKAAKFYLKCTMRVPADAYVDNQLLPYTEQVRRKVERLGTKQRREYLEQREQKRKELLDRENNIRRVRAIAAHCLLFRLRLFPLAMVVLHDEPNLHAQYTEAHKHLMEAFANCQLREEHNMLLQYFHYYLCKFSLWGYQEVSVEHQLLHGNGGTLAEAHIAILNDLLTMADSTEARAEYLEWLGKRDAEKCRFTSGRALFKAVRDEQAEVLPMDTALTLWTMGRGYQREAKSNQTGIGAEHVALTESTLSPYYADANDQKLVRAINKAVVMKYSKDNELDKTAAKKRDDFTSYGKPHEESNTILYKIPTQGWTCSSEAQLRRLQLLKLTAAMPPSREGVEQDLSCS